MGRVGLGPGESKWGCRGRVEKTDPPRTRLPPPGVQASESERYNNRDLDPHPGGVVTEKVGHQYP